MRWRIIMSTVQFSGFSKLMKKNHKVDFSHSNFGLAKKNEDQTKMQGSKDSFSLSQNISELLSPTCAMTEEEKQEYTKKIMAKLKAGKKLTTEEMHYLKDVNPDLYQKAAKVQAMRRALEEQLAHCKTKQEAQEAYMFSTSTVSEQDEMSEYIKAAYKDAYDEFCDSDEYKTLSEDEKEAQE